MRMDHQENEPLPGSVLLKSLFVSLVFLVPLIAWAQTPNGSQQTSNTSTGVRWKSKPVVDVRDHGALGDGQIAIDCYMAFGSAVLNCATNHFTSADVGKVIAVYENGSTTNGFLQPLSTTIASFQSGTQVTLSVTASNTTTNTVSAISSAARAVSVVTINTNASHNLSVGQIACISGASVDPTIIGCFQVQTTPTGTSFTIKQWQLLDNAALTITSGQVTGYSSHVVWGTNNDTNLANAANACGDQGGCTLLIPKGRYLTHGINLPCSTIGNFTAIGLGICTHVHNNITVQGDGIDITVLENWDAATSPGSNPNTNAAVITAGSQAAQYPYRGTLYPVTGLTVKGLTLWQVKNATSSLKGLRTDNTDGLVVDHVKVINWSYEGFYLSGIHYDAHDLYASQVGLGGPASFTAISALNAIGAWGTVHDSYVTDSGQCIEAGNPYQEVWHINCDGRGPDINPGISPHLGLNVTSNTYGSWDIHAHDNIFIGWTGEEFANVLGIFKDVSFTNNYIQDDTTGLSL